MIDPRMSLLAVAVAAVLTGCGGGQPDAGGPMTVNSNAKAPIVEDPGPLHIHGLGVNPSDGSLYLATHTGLFQLPKGETSKSSATRIADRYQDTMGFKVVGPDRFIGSGHPDGREGLPPLLGLIESDDAGERWKPVSLLGEADFHVLEASGPVVFGFDSTGGRLMRSDDQGQTWERRSAPEPLFGVAIDPADSDRLLASGESGLHRSVDGGETWEPLSRETGLIEWPENGGPYLAGVDGTIRSSDDGGETWKVAGNVSGSPVAFEAAAPTELYVALDDGSVQQSTNGGADWTLRFQP